MNETETCPECGAPLSSGAGCVAHFQAMLALEWEVPGGPGLVPHFYLVATYGLQHPAAMGYTVATLEGLRSAVADVLEGRTTIPDLRLRVRRMAAQAGRVTRRGQEPVPRWPLDRWPVVVTDVLPGGVDGYGERVERWARSVVETIGDAVPTLQAGV